MTTGELLGFLAPVAAVPALAGAGPEAGLAGMVAAGAFEGAALGAAQASVLVPGFRWRSWVTVTATAASFAWLLGMLPSTTYDLWSSWPVGLTAVVAVLLGALLLLSIGSAQAPLLPAGARLRWLVTTASGRCAGLGTFVVVTTPLWQPGQSALTVTIIGVVGGALMAFVMAVITATALPRARALALPGTGA